MSTRVEDQVLRNVIAIEGRASGVAIEMTEALVRARNTLFRSIPGTPQDSFQRFQQESLLSTIDSVLRPVAFENSTLIREARLEVINAEYESVSRALFAEARVAAPPEFGLPVGRLQALIEKPIQGFQVDKAIANTIGDVSKRLKQEIGQSILLQETLAQARKRIDDVFGVGRNRSDIIARTALLQSGSDARDQAYRDRSDVIVEYQYFATLDSSTCLICAPDDGRVEKKRSDLPALLRHPRCRCSIVARTEFSTVGTRPSVETLKTNPDGKTKRTMGDKYKGRVVKHRDGSTSTTKVPDRVKLVRGNTTFEQFFRRQPDAFQRSYLGPGKFDAWKSDGRPSLDSLRSFSNGEARILRLGELTKEMSN